MDAKVVKFTQAELAQIAAYVDERDNGIGGGWYYGNKRHFEARHWSIKAKLAVLQRERGK